MHLCTFSNCVMHNYTHSFSSAHAFGTSHKLSARLHIQQAYTHRYVYTYTEPTEAELVIRTASGFREW